MRPFVLAVIVALAPTVALAQPAALESEVDALRAEKPAWRGIAWKSCLVEGIAAARAEKKPILLWMFIDRPIDDARC